MFIINLFILSNIKNILVLFYLSRLCFLYNYYNNILL